MLMNIHRCDNGLPSGEVACECYLGRDHSAAECPTCGPVLERSAATPLSEIEDGGRVFSGQNTTTPAYGSPRAPSPEVTEK